VLATAAKAKASGGSTAISYVFIVLVFGLIYVFFLRPRSQAARRQRDTMMELTPGDAVLTGAGIFGTVLDVEADRVTLETAPGTRITVLRSTISRRITEPDGSSVAEQNWQDQTEHEQTEHDQVGGHDDGGHGGSGHDNGHDDDEEPQADGAGAGHGGGR
jgi:preprotein translocase subunit YajC